MTAVIIRWRCPKCGEKHTWSWDKRDIIEGLIDMACEGCGEHIKCHISLNGKVEVIKDEIPNKHTDTMTYRFHCWLDKSGKESSDGKNCNIGMVTCTKGLMKGISTPLHKRILYKLRVKPGDVFIKTETYETVKSKKVKV